LTQSAKRLLQQYRQIADIKPAIRSRLSPPLASGFKLDIGNPVALAPVQAGLFILALEG
jgi:hypothetical protein